ncbi:hypothetical protein CTU88_38675 [Streptomyces sp. JV178]|nr:hypothetical protein CTU88_38675 [Streptomyces sp. JV178]
MHQQVQSSSAATVTALQRVLVVERHDTMRDGIHPVSPTCVVVHPVSRPDNWRDTFARAVADPAPDSPR